MQYEKCNINTFCIGQASSMGAVLLSAGTKGKRYILPHARVMIHQPWGGMQGAAADINIHVKEILNLRDRIYQILVDHTGQSIEKIKKDCDRDYFMSSEEAKKYGLVDEVISLMKDVKKK